MASVCLYPASHSQRTALSQMRLGVTDHAITSFRFHTINAGVYPVYAMKGSIRCPDSQCCAAFCSYLFHWQVSQLSSDWAPLQHHQQKQHQQGWARGHGRWQPVPRGTAPRQPAGGRHPTSTAGAQSGHEHQQQAAAAHARGPGGVWRPLWVRGAGGRGQCVLVLSQRKSTQQGVLVHHINHTHACLHIDVEHSKS